MVDESISLLYENEFYRKMINRVDIEDFEGCELYNVFIKVNNNELIYRSKVYLDDILPDREIYLDDQLHFIKSVKINREGDCVLITTYDELEIENLYKSYLEQNLEFELPNDNYATFYLTEGVDYKELYEKGLNEYIEIKAHIYSYKEFKNNLQEVGLGNYKKQVGY